LQDFTTGSRALFQDPAAQLIQLNVAAFDAHKHRALPLIADAGAGLAALSGALDGARAPESWFDLARRRIADWSQVAEAALAPPDAGPATSLPSDAQVIGAVNRAAGAEDIVVGAAGGLPGELHKLWQAARPGGYHLEYGYSCMGYEIAGGLGVKMADPDREVIVLVGDGSYLMLNSEIATSVLLGRKIIVVVLDNRGFGCIDRLQVATGGARFNNLFAASHSGGEIPDIDFAAHAASLGAKAEKVSGIAELEAALERAKAADKTYVVVIDTDPMAATAEGGAWWDVAVPEVSERAEVGRARKEYVEATAKQRVEG
jgi:3D-(3,5/4)-trihydroxycyclohexane-1,2-dione acylhydrolase (decyclizing)